MDDSSVIHTLQLLHPKLEAQLLLAKQVALIEPLKDLASNEMELMLAASQTSNAAMTSVVSSPPDTTSETTSANMFSPGKVIRAFSVFSGRREGLFNSEVGNPSK